MAICFSCIVALTLKTSQSSTVTLEEEESQNSSTVNTAVLGVIVIFCASWMKAGIDILARKLQGAHWSLVLFWNAFFGFVVPLFGLVVYILVTGAKFLEFSDSKAWLWILFGSVCDTLTALFNIIAF